MRSASGLASCEAHQRPRRRSTDLLPVLADPHHQGGVLPVKNDSFWIVGMIYLGLAGLNDYLFGKTLLLGMGAYCLYLHYRRER